MGEQQTVLELERKGVGRRREKMKMVHVHLVLTIYKQIIALFHSYQLLLGSSPLAMLAMATATAAIAAATTSITMISQYTKCKAK